jgi:NADPH-dependent 2,4-dienoyl-CoA reductase/sulfur reductase-like enzyme
VRLFRVASLDSFDSFDLSTIPTSTFPTSPGRPLKFSDLRLRTFGVALASVVQRRKPMNETFKPVLIAGAGPTGTMAAIELSRFNIPVRLIEKKAEPETSSRAICPSKNA